MEQYLQTKQQLVERAQTLDVFDRMERFNQFSFFSANLTNFIPLLDPTHHLSLFREAFLNQQLSLLDDRYFTSGVPVAIHGWNDAIAPALRDQPGIICTLHAGSYRILSYLLTTSKMPFAVLMAGQAAKEQGKVFQTRYAEWQKRHGGHMELPIISAEEPGALRQVARCLRAGYHLLFYLDGFAGMPADMKRHMLRLPFLGQHLYARKGAAWLAQRAGVPLYAINNIRQADGSLLMVADRPIQPMDMPSHIFADFAMSRMFSFFGNQVLQAPAQWENWFFMHFQLDVSELTAPAPLRISLENDAVDALPDWSRYGLYQHGKKYYLLEKKGYKSYEMKRTYFNRLWAYWRDQTC